MPDITTVGEMMRSEEQKGSLTSSENSSLTRVERLAIQTRERYGTGEQFLMLFNPSHQTGYCRDIERVHMGTAPSLAIVTKAYGVGVSKSWLVAQLFDLSEFAGCRDKITDSQLRSLSELMLDTYGYFKIPEFMLFFLRFKKGCYGKFYGSIDPMVIMCALKDFNTERVRDITRFEKEREQEEQEADSRAWDEMRDDYRDDVPGAFTPWQWMNFIEYQRDCARVTEQERKKRIEMAGIIKAAGWVSDILEKLDMLMCEIALKMESMPKNAKRRRHVQDGF